MAIIVTYDYVSIAYGIKELYDIPT